MGKDVRWGNISILRLFAILISCLEELFRVDDVLLDFFCGLVDNVLFDCVFFDAIPVVSLLVFFFSAAAVFDSTDDDRVVVLDVPVDDVIFFPTEFLHEFFWEFDEEVF